MQVQWTVPALRGIAQIKSKYFSNEETDEYRVKLVERIEAKILRTGPLFRSRNYKNTLTFILLKRSNTHVKTKKPKQECLKKNATA
jgi:hypothetical protein